MCFLFMSQPGCNWEYDFYSNWEYDFPILAAPSTSVFVLFLLFAGKGYIMAVHRDKINNPIKKGRLHHWLTSKIFRGYVRDEPEI